MKFSLLNIICLLALSESISLSRAQSLVEAANTQVPMVETTGVFTETIKIISNSRKIFVLSNTANQLTPGDFISLALDDKLAARAVVAKVHQGQVGIKILKIYSLAQWSRLRRNLDVQIVRGDDSMFGKKPKTTEDDGVPRINSEEDLYNDTVVENNVKGSIDEGDLEESGNRHIKPDNVVGVSVGYLTADIPATIGGGKEKTNEFGASWAYQFKDNWFVEGLYGRALFSNYPGDGISTLVNRLQARLKYNFKGPAYTFIMPYIGYQNMSVSSPDAGKNNGPQLNQEELDAIDKIRRKSGPTFGVTLLRRLVPGWFVRADLGTDNMTLGASVEF